MKFLISLIIFFCASCSNNKHEKPAAASDTLVPSAVADTSQIKNTRLSDNHEVGARIEKQVGQIDNTVFQDSIYLENEDFLDGSPDGGGSLTGYFKNGTLVKINEWIGLSYGVMQHSYYFNDGQLIYVLAKEDYFAVNDSTGTDHSKFDEYYKGNYYFSHQKIIGSIKSGDKRFEDNMNDAEKEFLKSADDYKKLLLDKHKNRK